MSLARLGHICYIEDIVTECLFWPKTQLKHLILSIQPTQTSRAHRLPTNGGPGPGPIRHGTTAPGTISPTRQVSPATAPRPHPAVLGLLCASRAMRAGPGRPGESGLQPKHGTPRQTVPCKELGQQSHASGRPGWHGPFGHLYSQPQHIVFLSTTTPPLLRRPHPSSSPPSITPATHLVHCPRCSALLLPHPSSSSSSASSARLRRPWRPAGHHPQSAASSLLHLFPATTTPPYAP